MWDMDKEGPARKVWRISITLPKLQDRQKLAINVRIQSDMWPPPFDTFQFKRQRKSCHFEAKFVFDETHAKSNQSQDRKKWQICRIDKNMSAKGVCSFYIFRNFKKALKISVRIFALTIRRFCCFFVPWSIIFFTNQKWALQIFLNKTNLLKTQNLFKRLGFMPNKNNQWNLISKENYDLFKKRLNLLFGMFEALEVKCMTKAKMFTKIVFQTSKV